MNPYFIIAALVTGVIGIAGVGWGGFELGVDHQKAAESDKKDLVAKAAEAAGQASAKAISQIRITNTTIQQEIQHETRTERVYLDCRHTPDGLFLVNAALTGAERPGGGQLPKADAAGR